MRVSRILRNLFPSSTELAATLRAYTYMEDGLITRHTADFLKERRFVSAYAKGKATGIDITSTTDRTHEMIIATSATELAIKSLLILGVNLKNQPCIVADTASKRQVEHNLLHLNPIAQHTREIRGAINLSTTGERVTLQ